MIFFTLSYEFHNNFFYLLFFNQQIVFLKFKIKHFINYISKCISFLSILLSIMTLKFIIFKRTVKYISLKLYDFSLSLHKILNL